MHKRGRHWHSVSARKTKKKEVVTDSKEGCNDKVVHWNAEKRTGQIDEEVWQKRLIGTVKKKGRMSHTHDRTTTHRDAQEEKKIEQRASSGFHLLGEPHHLVREQPLRHTTPHQVRQSK